jgi:predicted  nucleic acid-binding Zn-ribbon protein
MLDEEIALVEAATARLGPGVAGNRTDADADADADTDRDPDADADADTDRDPDADADEATQRAVLRMVEARMRAEKPEERTNDYS